MMNSKTGRLQLNDEQRAAAFYSGNAVVAAGAGSGKTMVLASRFAWLLTEKGYKVNEILTLTFTNKAAAQMYRRIHSLLTEIAENETGLAASRARQALDDFIHARIQTLDSYSASLVRLCAPRYGISPDYAIDQGRCYEIALEESLPFLIACRGHPAVEKLYQDYSPKDIARRIFTKVLFNYCHIDKERDFFSDVKKQFDIICAEWETQRNELTFALKEIEDGILEDPDMFPAIVPIMEKVKKKKIVIPERADLRNFFDQLLDTPVESFIDKAESHPLQQIIPEVLYSIAAVCAVSLVGGKRKGGNPIKDKVKEIRACFSGFSSMALFCLQAGFVLSLASLFTKLQRRYLDKKRGEGVLSFKDVADLAITILLEQEDIRRNEKESFKAIMIDEFQDNNGLQKDLLFLLAEKPDLMNKSVPPPEDLCADKLFFVGDEKQSVYLFRGADVSVFRKLKDELKSCDLPLKINYRSSPRLIGAFNAVFGGCNFDPKGKTTLNVMPSVFAPSSPDLPLYEAVYTPLQSGKEIPGKMSVFILDRNEESAAGEDGALLPADENEARFTAEKIQSLLNEKTETGGQKYKPEDIAILFRAHTPQYHFEKHLRQLGIPYSCEDVGNFFYGGLVNDIMSVLRLSAYPLDSASYAEMLRSPFAGLSMPGLGICLSLYKEADKPEPFTDEPLQYLDEEDQNKYRQGQRIYASIYSKAAGGSISDLVSELWYKEGYRFETAWNPQVSVYRELYDYLFHLAVIADSENQGLAAFTDSMRDLKVSGERLSEINIPLERPGAVHLMTIHKSKGLEFPVVFLCCCGKRSVSNSRGGAHLSDEAGVVFIPPLPDSCASISGIKNNFFWTRSVAEEKRKRTAELRRLLYVGMTRAEKELYITGNLKVKNSEKTDNFSLNIKNFIEDKYGNNDNPIPCDSILDNDTFFGLLLPAIVPHITAEGPAEDHNFFSLDPIPVYTEDYVSKWEAKSPGLPNNQEGLSAFIEKTSPFYQNAKVILTPVIRGNHLTPVSLRTTEDSEPDGFPSSAVSSNREFSGEKADDIFNKVDSALSRFRENDDDYGGKFNSGSFGTIAHICVESLLKGEEPIIPYDIAGFLTPQEAECFLSAGNELAVRFLRSPLGKIAQKASFCKNEFPFRSLIKNGSGNEVFISGTVDLLFENSAAVHVVDFKTDGMELPQEHAAQMACYYRAANDLFAIPANKECRVWLYYLRTGHAMEMTQKAKMFDLEQRAFSR
jgi:ATP-dependent helicase/nuclease subunit A